MADLSFGDIALMPGPAMEVKQFSQPDDFSKAYLLFSRVCAIPRPVPRPVQQPETQFVAQLSLYLINWW